MICFLDYDANAYIDKYCQQHHSSFSCIDYRRVIPHAKYSSYSLSFRKQIGITRDSYHQSHEINQRIPHHSK